LCGLLCAGLTCLALTAAPALAHTVNFIIYTGKSIDGHGTTFVNAKGNAATGIYESGEELPWRLSGFIAGADIHQADGHLIVFDDGYVYTGNEGEYWQGILMQFSGTGTPVPFSGLTHGVNAIANIPGYNGAVAVDNSGTSTDGNIYLHTWDNAVRGYDPSGLPLAGNFPIEFGSDSICGLAVGPGGEVWIADRSTSKVVQFDSGGSPTGVEISPGFQPCWIETDAAGNVYVTAEGFGGTVKYDSTGHELLQFETEQYSYGLGVDRGNGNVYIAHYGSINAYKADGTFIDAFGEPDPDHSFGGIGNTVDIAVNASNHEIYVADSGGGPFDPHYVHVFKPTGEITVPDVTTEGAEVTPTTATVHGKLNPDGLDTTDCHFEFGEDTTYNEGSVPCVEGDIFEGSANYQVSAVLEDLTPGTTYHYRLVSNNANGISTPGFDQSFKPQGPPGISNETVSDVNTDNATLGADVDPSGLATTFHFELGTDTNYGLDLPSPDGALTSISTIETKSQIVGDTEATRLHPDTTYHFRVVATNEQGTTESADQTFHTFANEEGGADACPNAHERQQTGAALLDDCRAYELVSAPNAGGYDVQSDVILGQSVLAARPDAHDRVLYSLHFGKVPGISGGPTNFGLDPYVATRGASGWSTRYVGLPADGSPASKPFGSPISGSDGDLGAFAFGGSGLCSPCFGDGSTGIPVRMPDGSLVQGMSGSLDPGPGATQAGFVGQRLSDDGTHLVFGSTSKFEPVNSGVGDVLIYDRDLANGTTHIVSRTQSGATMTGSGVGELGISDDGSRIVVGKLISTDPFGVKHWHPYYSVDDSATTIDLAPATTTGVVFSGMSAGGSSLYFTTRDKLAGGDTDNSIDLYRADVSGEGVNLTRVSTGPGGGNADSCNPVASFDSSTWNNLEGSPSCDVLAFAGGAGVSDSGAVYFLSPEKLDGHGTQDQPNLFVSRPGDPLRFVATIEPNSAAIHNGLANSEVHTFGDLQTTPDGVVAVFDSRLPLTNYPNAGHSEIYRYDYAANQVVCASCALTRATATGDTSLSTSGLNLSDDGRVFFSSPEQLVLRDANGKRDAYEWEAGDNELISTGSHPADAGLLSVSSDGVNAYFFTRQTIVPADENGTAMKIYAARERGGFGTFPPPVPCQASDECHGAGSQAPPPVSVGTLKGELGNVTRESCDAGKLVSLAKSLSHRASELRRRAARLSADGSDKSQRAAKRYRKQAQRLSKAAKKAESEAEKCRRQSRRSK
jgi:hypothetical protein